MKFKTLNGREVNKSITKYLIDWTGPSLSKPQYELKRFLYSFWSTDIVCEEMPTFGLSRLRGDFVNLSRRIFIEESGEFHFSFNKHIHANNRLKFLRSIKNDENKRLWAETNRFHFIEIHANDVKNLSVKYFKDHFDIDLM